MVVPTMRGRDLSSLAHNNAPSQYNTRGRVSGRAPAHTDPFKRQAGAEAVESRCSQSCSIHSAQARRTTGTGTSTPFLPGHSCPSKRTACAQFFPCYLALTLLKSKGSPYVSIPLTWFVLHWITGRQRVRPSGSVGIGEPVDWRERGTNHIDANPIDANHGELRAPASGV